MKSIKCEMCESNDVIKTDGYYVCQSCGTKYSVEEAKKLLVDNTESEIKSSVNDRNEVTSKSKNKKKLILAIIAILIILTVGITITLVLLNNQQSSLIGSSNTETEEAEVDIDGIINNIQAGNYREAKRLILDVSKEQFSEYEERILSAYKEAVKTNKLKYNGNIAKLITDCNSKSGTYTQLQYLYEAINEKSSSSLDNYSQYILAVKDFNTNYRDYKTYLEYYNSSECRNLIALTQNLDMSYGGLYANMTAMLGFDYSNLQDLSYSDTYCKELLQAFLDYMGATIDYMDAVYGQQSIDNASDALQNLTQVYTKLDEIVSDESDLESSILSDYNALPSLD